MTDNLQKVTPTQDGDGHWYIIPTELLEEFNKDLDLGETSGDFDNFEEKWGKYTTGGDIDCGVQFYADLSTLTN